MRIWLVSVVSLLLVAAVAEADPAKPGDIVKVEAASLTFGGELVTDETDVVRLKLESGVIAIPKSLVTSMTVVRAAPVAPSLVPPGTPGAPSLSTPKGVWLSKWGSGLALAVIAGSGGEHDMPVKARTGPASAGGSLGYERSLPYLSLGGGLSYEQMQESLVASGKTACPENADGGCFEFPNGLAHTTSSAGGLLYAKPYFMWRRARVWVRGGAELMQVSYAYRSTKETYGKGSATAIGIRYGGGVDVATDRRRLVLSIGVDAGGARHKEKIKRLFGAPFESDGEGSRATDARLEIGLMIPFGGRR